MELKEIHRKGVYSALQRFTRSPKLLYTITVAVSVISFCYALQCPLLCLAKSSSTKKPPPFIDSMIHDIDVITPSSFGTKINRNRDSHVSAVLFYTRDENTKNLLQKEYNDFAKQSKGLVTIGAADCDEFPLFCSQQNVRQFPTIIIYPPFPMAAYPLMGEINIDRVRKLSYDHIEGKNIQVLTPENIENFLNIRIAVPKVLLFSAKPEGSVLFKALSNSFKGKLDFGFISTSDESSKALQSRFKITTSPSLIVVRESRKAPEVFKGKTDYNTMHDWLNVYAETFVLGGGFSDTDTGGQHDKPWLHERIPQITLESYQDICFDKSDKSKGLCVIYLKHGGSLDPVESKLIETLSGKFTSHLADRGPRFRWMWMNTSIERAFAELFEVDAEPSVVVFNPYKRLRFIKLDKEANAENISSLLDKINGGDARFKNVPGQKIPAFVDRKEAEAKTKRKEEL